MVKPARARYFDPEHLGNVLVGCGGNPALGPGEVNPFEHGDPGSSTHATKPLQLGGGEASSSASAWNNLTQGGN